MADQPANNKPFSPFASEQIAEDKSTTASRVRWSWMPSLLFGDGLLVAVIVLVMIMLRRFGLDHTTTTLYVFLVCLPFLMRPFMEMLVTHFHGTTKVWVLSSEFLISLSLWAIAFTLPTSYWLQGTLCFMPFVTLSGVFHNIAVSRFYVDLPSVASAQQTFVVRLFRCMALLFGTGAVIMLAGNLEVVTRNVRYSWSVAFYVMAAVEFFLWLWHSLFLPGGSTPYVGEKDSFGLHPCEYNAVTNGIVGGWRERFKAYFFLFFILPVAFAMPMSLLFVVDAPHNGGLGLSPQEFALVQGTVGVIGVFVGVGTGRKITRLWGLRKGLVLLSFALPLHGLSFLYLCIQMPSSLAVISMAIAIGNVALGFCVAAYEDALDCYAQQSRGYVMRRACALTLTSLTIVVVGMSSGLLLTDIGYHQMFVLSASLCVVAVIVAVVFSMLKPNNAI